MANTPQSRKRARQAEKRRQLNASQRSMVRTYIKKVVKLLAAEDLVGAQVAYKEAVPILDRYACRGLIHQNKAARHKSRLNKRLKELFMKQQAANNPEVAQAS